MSGKMINESPQNDEDAGFEIELIGLVKAHEELYNRNHTAYGDVDLKQKLWEDIAIKLKRPVDQCQTVWRDISQQYWEYERFESMSFLESYCQQRNEANDSLPSSSSESLVISTSISNYITESSNDDNEISLFLRELEVEFKHMPSTEFANLQKDIRQLIAKRKEK